MGDKQGCIGRVGQFYISVAGEERYRVRLLNYV